MILAEFSAKIIEVLNHPTKPSPKPIMACIQDPANPALYHEVALKEIRILEGGTAFVFILIEEGKSK